MELTPYVWGGCSVKGCDCSGLVCYNLNLLYNQRIRVTANDLYNVYFTKTKIHSYDIAAVFFLDKKGKAIHVSPRLSGDFYLNESSIEPSQSATVRKLYELEQMYEGFTPVLRALPKGAWKSIL